jgi:hypothetical protein
MKFPLPREIKALLSEAQLINHHPITIDLVLLRQFSLLCLPIGVGLPGVMIAFVSLKMFG